MVAKRLARRSGTCCFAGAVRGPAVECVLVGTVIQTTIDFRRSINGQV
jgi:hypothetical protein